MNAADFQAASIGLLRSAVGWQSAVARRLGCDSRQVRYWLKADATPAWVDEKLGELMGGIGPGPWPRDEWVTGDTVGGDGKRREYVVHLAPPRFCARIVAVDEDGEPLPEEHPCDVISGTVLSSDDFYLCEIDWIDTPKPSAVTHLLDAAADAVDAA